MLEEFSLAGKKALVTGGNGGLGLACAEKLAEAGAAVAIIGRNAVKNDKAQNHLRTKHPGCHSFICDLERTDGLKAAYREISEAMGGIDLLINNAGIQIRGRADEISTSDFEKVMRINCTAPYVLSQAFAAERLSGKKSGSIIMIGSLMCEASRPGTSPYTSSKGAVRQMIKALAVDWAPYNIRVNGIGPGYYATEMNKPLVDNPEFSAWVKKRTPLGRWGEPDDIGGTAVFLMSEAARFITGQIIYVDGGWLAAF